jgi:SpoVK/Ycf46/Vps4 family AAA+-type ATPase
MKTIEIKKDELFEAIHSIYYLSEGLVPCKELYDLVDLELDKLVSYTNLSKEEAFIFAIIFYINLIGETASMTQFCRYFNTNSFALLKLVETIQELMDKGVINGKKSRSRGENILFNYSFTISKAITYNLLKGKEFPIIASKKIEQEIELIEAFHATVEQCIDAEIQEFDIEDIFNNYLQSYPNFAVVKLIEDFKLTRQESLLYYYIIWKTLMGQNSIDIDQAQSVIFTSNQEQVSFIQSLILGTNSLIKFDLIEYTSAGFLNNSEANPTRRTAELLKEINVIIPIPTSKGNPVILPTETIAKELFYNEKVNKQIQEIASILEEEKYNQLVQRMSDKGLPQGVNILFYGAPGTGKTESVIQLAKATGREIIKVDISSTKSKWFGESEKMIKRVFNDYATYAKHSVKTPILLFNEADAILSTRSTSGNASTQQTENAIQNILLEELENFKGILMATTNLMSNLDKAFERRFLYKVEFSIPTIEHRVQIWQSKFPAINSADCEFLAQHVELSGGQIDNIYRKTEINDIIHNQPADLEVLVAYCEQEVNHSKKRGVIGF